MKNKPLTKHKQRLQTKQEMQAIQNLGLYLVLGPDFKITSKATVNAELTKGILASLWEEGQKAAAKQGCDLSIVNLSFVRSPKVMYEWEIKHKGIVPFSHYPNFEMVVEFSSSDGKYFDMLPTAVYESLVHRFSHHYLWSKGVSNNYDVLDFMVVRNQTGMWIPAFNNDLVFDKNAIDNFTITN